MSNISQIEINNTTYNLIDAVATNTIDRLQDYFCTTDPYLTPYSSDHARFFIGNSIALSTGKYDEDYPLYRINMWDDTGNIRNDKYDETTGELTRRGYIPLTKNPTKTCVSSVVGASSVITAGSGITITGGGVQTWGQLVKMSLAFKSSSAINDPLGGNISNVTVGTIQEKYRPAIEQGLRSNGDAFGGAWGNIAPNGTIHLCALDGRNAAFSVAANTVIHLGGIWIAAMDNNFT